MKKKIIISTIIIMLYSMLYHSAYKVIKIPIFPVNESIWEHGKMIILSFLSYACTEKYILKNKDSNFLENLISSIICMLLDFAVFLPVFLYILKTQDNMFITILIYVICIIVSLIIKEKCLRVKDNRYISIILIIIITGIFLLFTYYPIRNSLFYDYSKNIYGEE